ncbi:MAG: DUF2066 domain-containing protein [Alphaproteobacteria bacterium]
MGRLGRTRLVAASLVGLLFIVSAHPVLGQDVARGLFSVWGVPVDATAADASVAREKALIDGQRLGLRRVFERLAVADDYARLPNLSDEQIKQMVVGFQILDERVAPDRYRATLNIDFKEDDVRRALRSAGARFSESRSRPIVVLPVYIDGETPILWDEPNPWRATWSARSETLDLVPLIAPLGDLEDIVTVTAEQAIAGEPAPLTAIADRYGALESLVAIAVVARESLAVAPRLTVSLHRAGGAPIGLEGFSLDALPGQTAEPLFSAAIDEMARALNENWKRANLLRFDVSGTLRAEIPVRSLNDWLNIRARLGNLPVIDRIELIAISRNYALVSLKYFGEREQLAYALRQAELYLSGGPEGWRLSRRPGSE